MKTIIHIICLALMLLSISFSSCKKKKSTPAPVTNDPPAPTPVNKRLVKYEITGNFSGQLLVAYTNATGATESVNVLSLPWSKELTCINSVGGVGLGGNGVPSNLGAANQSVSVKLYAAGNVVQSANGSTDANGIINFPSLAYVF